MPDEPDTNLGAAPNGGIGSLGDLTREMSYAPTLAEAIDKTIYSSLTMIRVALPGIVRSYSPESRSANVQPALTEHDGTSLPVIASVPVLFPSAGDFGMTWPLPAGSTGVLFFSDRDIDRWDHSGGLQPPGSARRFDWSDALFYPGLRPQSDALPADPEDMLIGKTDGSLQIRITAAGEVSIGGPGGELLTILDEALNALVTATAGGFPLDPGTILTLVGLIGELATIRVP